MTTNWKWRRGKFFAVLLMACLVAGPGQAAPTVRPLNLKMIDGKPGLEAHGSVPIGANEFMRLMRLRALAKFGDEFLGFGMADIKTAKGPLDCVLAMENLVRSARENVLTDSGIAGKSHCVSTRRGKQNYYRWRGNNKLDMEDNEARFRKRYLPDIKAAAGKVAAMEAVKEIVLVHSIWVREGSYSREKQAFKIHINPWAQDELGVLRIEHARPIKYWPVPEARARQVMNEFFRKGGDPMLRVVVTVRLGDVIRVGKTYRVLGRVKDVRIYRRKDEALAKLLYRFKEKDYTDYDSLARAREKASIAKMPRLKFVNGPYLWAAYAALSGKGQKFIDEVLDGRRWNPDPFKARKQKEAERKRMRGLLADAAGRFDRNEKVWIKGMMVFNTYNMDEAYFPVRDVKLQVKSRVDDTDASLVSIQLFDEQFRRLPIPPDIAEGIAARGYAYFRALVQPVEATEYVDDGKRSGKPRVLGQTVRMAIARIELLRDEKSVGVQYDKNLLWSYSPISHAKIKKQAAQEEDDLAKLKRECETTGKSECYRTLCGRIKAGASRGEYKACRQAYASALKREQQAKLNATQAAMAAAVAPPATQAKPAMPNTNSRATCNKKYGGRDAQPWMPVPNSPEYKQAIAHCLQQPVRQVYGRDILGLRLGMPHNEAARYIQRQSFDRNVLTTEPRPFEKGGLGISRDKTDGLAVFYLRNGDAERVAAVSRRLYFKDGAMAATKLMQGLRKKYGKESWSRGNEVLLWLDADKGASARSCAGIASLIEERSGWRNGGWVVRTKGVDTGQASTAIGMQSGMSAMTAQQECVAKYGMPGGGGPGMSEQLQKLQRCMQGKMAAIGAGAQATGDLVGKDNKVRRRPHMVKTIGSPAMYARYKACGPMLVALFNNGSGSSVKDLSLLLFDPDWIGRQPAFAFKEKDGGGPRF